MLKIWSMKQKQAQADLAEGKSKKKKVTAVRPRFHSIAIEKHMLIPLAGTIACPKRSIHFHQHPQPGM